MATHLDEIDGERQLNLVQRHGKKPVAEGVEKVKSKVPPRAKKPSPKKLNPDP